jgi:Kdo2-lipid IVA lauroyltransferase/acyltransferase
MPRKTTKTIDLLVFCVFGALQALFFLLPRKACLGLGRQLGSFLFRADRRHREIVLANLETAFGGELPLEERRRIARDSFRTFGQVLADTVKWAHLSHRKRLRLLSLEGGDHLRRALEEGRGAMLFSAHLGNWEVASLAVSRFARLNVVARPLDSRVLERWLLRFRKSLGARVISKFQAAKPVLQALRRNEVVAILMDQNVLRSQAVFVDFFGRPAATTPALGSFFARARSPLLPVFCYPTASFSYTVKIGPPVEVELSGSLDEDVLKITRHCTKMIESEIRQNPSLWFWFHNRWKTRPPAAPSTAGAGSKNEA